MPVDDTHHHEDRHRFTSLPLVQREVVLVLVLCIVSAALYAGTKSLADSSRATSAADAASWYQRGQTLVDQGQLDDAIAALRRAVVGDRQNLTYARALARALTKSQTPIHDEEARQLLLRLREQAPDDSEINLRLARLARQRGDVAQAEQYYNHAMYGVASADPQYDRSTVREELVRFLLDQQDSAAALTELGALARELPNQPAAHLDLAQLFDRAGDRKQALAHYAAAAALDPTSTAALVGAGTAAFALHDYAQAARDLDAAARLGPLAAERQAELDSAHAVLAADPLAAGLGMADRVRRLTAGLDAAAARLKACRPAAGAAPPAGARRCATPTCSRTASR
jgi:tetratricopeptide (TPR) repeat protein